MYSKISFDRLFPFFKEKYTFEFCSLDEKQKLIDFIDRYWKHNHALVLSSKLLDWQHLDIEKQHYTFAVAKSKETGEIAAISGFIFSSQFDSTIEKPIRWGAIWKNRDDIDEPGLGMMVQEYMAKYAASEIGVGIGLSSMAQTVGKKQKNVMGKLSRYYILNTEMSKFYLVKNYEKEIAYKESAFENSRKSLKEIELCEYEKLPDSAFSGVPFFKSKKYYVNRYYKHPIYKYRASAIINNGVPEAVLFWRICSHNDAQCIRIVDYTGNGNELAGCGEAFRKMLREQNSEFVDFINVGIDAENFYNGGFADVKDSDIILAHYFEPFLLEDENLFYEWDNHDVPVLIFKGDSDQDRPNVIEG